MTQQHKYSPGGYVIDREDYGLYIKLSGKLCALSLRQWMQELRDGMSTMNRSFGIILDLREALPICTDAARTLTYARSFFHGRGLNRLAIVYESSAVIATLMSSFNELGTDKNERHISSLVDNDWKATALAWVQKGVEP